MRAVLFSKRLLTAIFFLRGESSRATELTSLITIMITSLVVDAKVHGVAAPVVELSVIIRTRKQLTQTRYQLPVHFLCLQYYRY